MAAGRDLDRELPPVPPAEKETENADDDTTLQLALDPLDEDEALRKTRWKDLFNFLTRKHVPVLVLAVSCGVLCGLAIPGNAYLLGKIFDAFSQHAAGRKTADQLKDTVAMYCVYLTGLAAANWILNSIFFFAWILFGELQAKSARERIYRALLRRNMTWFDRRKNGVAAMIPRLQM